MTRRLYYDDAYQTRFEAEVVACDRREDGQWSVVLDATCFYPTSGGQMHDHGQLGGASVLDVIDEAARVVHVVSDASGWKIGDRLVGDIDEERRRHHRQQHSGQHVLSRVVEDRMGLPTVSSRLGETGNTLDLEVESLDADTLARLEDETNRRLWEGRPVTVRYLEEEEAGREGLRKKVEREGPVRVVDVEGLDRCACGGTHVRNTAEVGLVVLTGTEKIKGGTRVFFHCGDRALAFRRERQAWLDRCARQLTSGPEQVEAKVKSLLRETKDRQKRIVALARELVAVRASTWVETAEPGQLEGKPLRFVLRRLDADEALAAPQALGALIAQPDLLAALLLEDGSKAQLLIARGGELDCDCGTLLRDVVAAVGGKGGGKPDHARGGFPSEHIDRVCAELRARTGVEG